MASGRQFRCARKQPRSLCAAHALGFLMTASRSNASSLVNKRALRKEDRDNRITIAALARKMVWPPVRETHFGSVAAVTTRQDGREASAAATNATGAIRGQYSR